MMKKGIGRLWKLSCSAIICVTFFTAFKFEKDDYKKLFSMINLDARSYDDVYLMHFDFCSPDTKCNDTLEMESFFNDSRRKVALIIDTLYSSKVIPEYIDQTKTDIYYADRIWLQRQGIYTERQQRLIISRKGELKRRILLK